MERNERRTRIIQYVKFAVLILIVVVIPLFICVNYRQYIFNSDWLAKVPSMLEKGHNRRNAFIGLIGLQILQVIICVVPGEPIQVASSYFYGIGGGLIISIIGAIIGTTIAFYIARFLGNEAVQMIWGRDKVLGYQKKLGSTKALMIVLIFYLIPGIPKDLIAYVAGISEIEFFPFIVISSIARCPGMIGSLLIGMFVQEGNYVGVGITLALALIIIAIMYVVRDRIFAWIERIEERGRKHHGKTDQN